jgi:hypothetical protein
VSRGGSVGTGYVLDDRRFGVRLQRGSRIFTSPYLPDRLWGYPASYSMGTVGGALSPWKKFGCETDHSSPSSAEVKETWIYTTIPHTL